MRIRKALPTLVLGALFAAAPAHAADGLTVGGYIQFLYAQTDPTVGGTLEELEINRARLEFSGSPLQDWDARVAIDFGKDATQPTLRDAWIRYNALDWGTVTLGNQYVPFSREQTTADKNQQLVERTMAGDHDYGTPDRQMGVVLASKPGAIAWKAGVFRAGIDRGTARLDFDSSVNASADYFGTLVGGRVEWFPIRTFAAGQVDFERDNRVAFGLNAYQWSGGGTPTVVGSDWDAVTGIGADVAFRGQGWSLDLEHNFYDAETLDGTTTAGLAVAGEGALETTALEGGYLFAGDRFELVGGWERMTADAWVEAWTRQTVGANWYFKKHDLKLQFNVGEEQDARGVAGDDYGFVRLQMQMVFK